MLGGLLAMSTAMPALRFLVAAIATALTVAVPPPIVEAKPRPCAAPKPVQNKSARIEVRALRADGTTCRTARRIARHRQRLRDHGRQRHCIHEHDRFETIHCRAGRWQCTMKRRQGRKTGEHCRLGTRNIRWHWHDVSVG